MQVQMQAFCNVWPQHCLILCNYRAGRTPFLFGKGLNAVYFYASAKQESNLRRFIVDSITRFINGNRKKVYPRKTNSPYPLDANMQLENSASEL